jgi:hypothetical protein
MLGHASIHQTQRYLNVTDEGLRKGLEVSWGRSNRPELDPIVPNLSYSGRTTYD